MERGGCELIRHGIAALTLALLVTVAAPVEAQDRFKVSINAGTQGSTESFAETQTFQQYFEQGTFTFGRTVAKTLFYDAGVAVRLWRNMHAGASVSRFEDTGTGDLTAEVPHPLFFARPRSLTGEVAGVTRRELAQHVFVGWAIPAAGGLDFMLFGGPTVFTTEQMFVTTLMLSLDKESYPFDTLAFPGAVTENLRENLIGYHAGVDMTWRFARKVGVGILIRYANGKRDFTPTGGTPVEVTVGGLHAGGGLRLRF
jgi:hypothetical protein